MPSPFPGMDPYLEESGLWPGFYMGLATEIRAALNRSIRPRFFADLSISQTYDEIEVARPRAFPDGAVSQPQPPREGSIATVALAPAPVVSRIPWRSRSGCSASRSAPPGRSSS